MNNRYDANVGENISTGSSVTTKINAKSFFYKKIINYFSCYINNKLNLIVNKKICF